MHININFPGLEDVILKEFRSFEDRVEIFVEMPVYTHRCPRSGTRTKNGATLQKGGPFIFNAP